MPGSLTDLADLLTHWPILDTAIGLFWLWSVLSAWKHAPEPVVNECVAERGLGATVILGQLNGIITGSSIIIAGIGGFAALATSRPAASFAVHLTWAALFAILALGIALYTMSVLPTRTPRVNFVRSKGVAVLSAMALFFSLFAAIRFMLAILYYLT